MSNAYTQLEKKFKRIHVLGDAAGMLHWDMASMMPKGGAEARAEQLALMATMGHGLMVESEMADLLDQAEEETGLNVWQSANLREMRRSHTHATALDEDLVEAMSRATSSCEQLWRQARPEGDFKKIVPALKEVLNLSRQKAKAKSEKLSCSLYDALLDQYEPEGKAAEIDPIFTRLEGFLPSFLQEVLEKQQDKSFKKPAGPFALEKQEALGKKFMAALGFDFDHGRLDVSLHPFCGGIPDDVRLTTRYDEADFTSALMGVLHETGHALYERALPKEWRNQPVGTARGMSIHESQSLLVEMQVCRSDAFLTYALPHMKEAFAGAGPEWSLDNFTNLYREVKADYIRVDADEVTYPAHVILRYKLERALIEGDMEVEDIPHSWNEMMQKMLGITPPSDREGCLQDVHWYDGTWGYFPTYTLGAMSAAQLFESALKALPSLDEEIAKGEFGSLFQWLNSNVHGHGSLHSSKELMIKATGKALDPEVFINHLKKRYS
ncbi:Thermostable carboxypeptidase 1 [Candidatus Terasakiella magnetica]|uniref:Metal-dependent carboxypeptidase n=1 Tax=Candidatus Terasakiella magnetica TaxID=1867952 RepID=A0A1C3RI89_9PROT|nr:carboxypeptidase M32 [Candidatus Terasakiella magnetica]SCA56996.1 Thermostable carboxypeptidase 1 [Candidatus Terasakiella magnetica]